MYIDNIKKDFNMYHSALINSRGKVRCGKPKPGVENVEKYFHVQMQC